MADLEKSILSSLSEKGKGKSKSFKKKLNDKKKELEFEALELTGDELMKALKKGDAKLFTAALRAFISIDRSLPWEDD